MRIFVFHQVLTVYWIIRLIYGLKCLNLAKLSPNQHRLGSSVSHSELNIENNMEFTGFAVLLWLSTRSKPTANVFGNDTGKHTLITPELAILPDKLRFIWSSTRDRKLRKFTLPDKHRYGLEFQISHNYYSLQYILMCSRHQRQIRDLFVMCSRHQRQIRDLFVMCSRHQRQIRDLFVMCSRHQSYICQRLQRT